jgi:hypothetical protein
MAAKTPQQAPAPVYEKPVAERKTFKDVKEAEGYIEEMKKSKKWQTGHVGTRQDGVVFIRFIRVDETKWVESDAEPV